MFIFSMNNHTLLGFSDSKKSISVIIGVKSLCLSLAESREIRRETNTCGPVTEYYLCIVSRVSSGCTHCKQSGLVRPGNWKTVNSCLVSEADD